MQSRPRNPCRSGHDAQQGGLARAVESQHADLGAVIEAERNIAQDCLLGGTTFPTRFME